MTELEIRQARERLNLETKLNALLIDQREVDREIDRTNNALRMLNLYPEHYFGLDELTQQFKKKYCQLVKI